MDRTALLALLSTRITSLSLPHPVRVGIDGVDTSGKTTLADELARAIPERPVICASIDRFHNPRAVRYRLGPDSPEGYYRDSFDLDALKANLLVPLGPGGDRTIQTGQFDFRADAARASTPVEVPPNAILLFDGVFLQRPELSGCFDYTIFLQVSFETVLARAVERDCDLIGGAEAVIDRYTKRYIPAQQLYLDTCRPSGRADIVVLNDDPMNPQIR